jgi:hypothetical protein
LSDNRDTDVIDTWDPVNHEDYARAREEGRVATAAWLEYVAPSSLLSRSLLPSFTHFLHSFPLFPPAIFTHFLHSFPLFPPAIFTRFLVFRSFSLFSSFSSLAFFSIRLLSHSLRPLSINACKPQVPRAVASRARSCRAVGRRRR